MIKGMAETATLIRPMVKNELTRDLIERERIAGPDFSDQKAIFAADNRAPFLDLLDWINYPEPAMDSTTISTYEIALAYIGGIYKGIQQHESTRATYRRLICLGCMVSEQFIAFLEEQRPRALVF